MKVLVACEFSGKVRDSFIKKGHEALSCDLLPSESNLGEHYQGNVIDILNDGWDLMIAHPPCTHLSTSGARWFTEGLKSKELQKEALEFVNVLMNAPIERICIENPVSIISTQIREPDQIINPYMFGHNARKRTCLWLKNLPTLIPTEVVDPLLISYKGKTFSHDYGGTNLNYNKRRSVTYDGIANAMAAQWGSVKNGGLNF
tara:strand:+ start:672 stop:1277 length:606 start_codon:yes stop_codon:yes gene_type:complete